MRTLALLAALLLVVGLVAEPATAVPPHVSDAGLWVGAAAGGAIGHSKATSPWRWRLGGQGRFREDTDGFNQSILGVGLGVSPWKSITFFVGYDWLRTSPVRGFDFDEQRLLQEIAWSSAFRGLSVVARTRLEERMFSNTSGAALRWRGLAKLRWPLPSNSPVALVGRNEVFVNLNDHTRLIRSGLDQNRFFVGFDVALDNGRKSSLEVGYLNQFIEGGPRRDTLSNILSINLIFTP